MPGAMYDGERTTESSVMENKVSWEKGKASLSKISFYRLSNSGPERESDLSQVTQQAGRSVSLLFVSV